MSSDQPKEAHDVLRAGFSLIDQFDDPDVGRAVLLSGIAVEDAVRLGAILKDSSGQQEQT